MASNTQYEEIIFQINNLLKQEKLYPRYIQAINTGKKDYKISQVYTKKNYDDSWIDFIEECLIPLDTIVRNPRKFIVVEEDIVDISLAKSISVESVKHLAQHTNMIASVKKDGTVIPSKILNTSKEESFEIYENRFIYTLLLKANDFIDRRFQVIQEALVQAGEIGVNIKSSFDLEGAKVDFQLSNSANFPFEAAFKKQGEELSDVERVLRMKSIFSDFLSSPFAREMRTSALVRPPITRTNVILKDPNFKKALLLWQYVEGAESLEYKIDVSTEVVELNEALSEKYRSIVFLNTVLLQSIASIREDDSLLDKSEEDEQIVADEYITKNIDDFVPDDFPLLKMDLREIRSVYQQVPGQKPLNLTDIAKINMALDRVLRQYKINQAKEDSVVQKRLIARQLKEEVEAKKFALREAKEQERLKRQQEARDKLEAKRIEAQRILDLKRAEEERKEAERRAEEERQRFEEERIRLAEEERIKEEEIRKQIEDEAKARVIEERIARERAMAKEVEEQMREYYARLQEEQEEQIKALAERKKRYWEKEKELAIRLAIDQGKYEAERNIEKYKAKFFEDEEAKLITLKRLGYTITSAMIVEHYEEVEALLKEARLAKSEEEIQLIKKAYEETDLTKKEKRKLQRNLDKLKKETEEIAKQDEIVSKPRIDSDIYFIKGSRKRKKK